MYLQFSVENPGDQTYAYAAAKANVKLCAANEAKGLGAGKS
jgi:hypothetical protein